MTETGDEKYFQKVVIMLSRTNDKPPNIVIPQPQHLAMDENSQQ